MWCLRIRAAGKGTKTRPKNVGASRCRRQVLANPPSYCPSVGFRSPGSPKYMGTTCKLLFQNGSFKKNMKVLAPVFFNNRTPKKFKL